MKQSPLILPLALALALAGAGCDLPTEPTAPVEVPADYVRTPFGFFHPSCIGTTGDDGAHAVGLGACAHEHFALHGGSPAREEAAIESPDGSPDTAETDGWKASEWFQTTPLYWISAAWTVPAAPTTHGDQTLYYFPSLEPTTYDDIVQPVLAWNGYGDQAWTMTSWNCCETGNVWHSSPITVAVGDAVWGQAAGGSCAANGVCASWTIISGDTTTGQKTTLNATSGEVFTAAQGGVLETYGVTTCRDLAKSVKFTHVLVGKVGGTLVRPTWSPDIGQASPACGYTARASTSTGSSTITVADTP